MSRTLRWIYSGVTSVLVAVVVILAVLLVGVRIFGLTPYTVLSGSMEPSYHVGSLIYVQKTDPASLQVQDPVTYRMGDGTVVTHRVVEIVEDPAAGRCYRTKGDANNVADSSLLTEDRIIGKPLFTIPLLGYVSWYIQHPPGTYLAIAGCLLLMTLMMLTDAIFSNRDKPSAEDAPSDEPTETV